MQHLEIGKFFAGLSFFLYGMSQLESVLKSVSGRSLKLFLKRNTQSLFKSIAGGAIITGIVQSSSVVSLLVLAFVESGIITFRNALGVILGTNLGTTLDSWIVASIGFKLDILSYSLPIIAVTGIGMFLFEKRKKVYNLLTIFFALGILFLGLGFMKEGALQLVNDFDISAFTQYNTFSFVMIGFILTTIIQSSSATIAITLTAIYTGILTFPSAAAIVIGAEVGTTIKILFWGMKGTADKKRVAWGNFIYNFFTASLAFTFLHWLIYFIENIIQIKDPLIGLVFFQTSINLVSIFLFIPFLNIFALWLEHKFISDSSNGNSYISKNLPVLPILVTDALRNEIVTLLKKTLLFNKELLCFEKTHEGNFIQNIKKFAQTETTIEDEYSRLKQTEGDILQYYANFQESSLTKEDSTLILQYVNAMRQSIFAAKAIKDISHNLRNFNNSANDIIHRQCKIIREEWHAFDNALTLLLSLSDKSLLDAEIETLSADALRLEEIQKLEIMQQLKNNQLNELEASTLMNVHHEIYSSKKSLYLSLQNLGMDVSKN